MAQESCELTNVYGIFISVPSLIDSIKRRSLKVSGENVDVRIDIEGTVKDFTFEEFLHKLGFKEAK